ncbi:N-6 DNA methylase [Treponema primitia ZAS-2]|uniref:site-specific DNA-methyltransferase (adenine-specific) n=2 Tax=Treponema primitia TaxID=88058 RepID=F5YQZ7_TREPZ|nr:N-6 DNA methylase [Treponema primitia ZAS-2]
MDDTVKRRIDTARDILVGKVPVPSSQVEQITIALIYKFMDDMDKEAIAMGGKSSFFTGEYKKYAWSKIFDPRLGGFELISLYGEAITKLNQNPHIPQLFRDIFKNAYLPYRDPETLKLFLKTINEFTYDHSEDLGDAFEYLLSVLDSQGDAGQFRTPRHIIDFMVEVVDPQKHETIIDPACGTAGFLVSSYKHIRRSNTNKRPGDLLTPTERKKLLTNFKGYDISPDMVRLSLVNLYLHGFVQPQIYEYDTLTSEDRWNEYADVILANPPFMSPKGGIIPHKRFSVQSKRSEVLFVDYIAEHLTPAGRAAVIVPEGIIFQSGTAYKQLRKMLVEKYLYAVVSLPSGVFNPYSGVKTSILLLDRQLTSKSDAVLFVKIENDGLALGAQRREIEKNDLPEALKLIRAYQKAVRAGKGRGFKDEGKNGALVVQKDKLAENGEYSLTGERYRVVERRGKQKWPMVRIGDICDLYNGKAFKPSDWEKKENGGLPIIRIQNLNNEKVDFNYYSGNIDDQVIINEGDLLFSWSGSKGTSFGPHIWKRQKAILNQHIFKVEHKDCVQKNFLYHMLKFAVTEVEENLHGGVGLVHITKGDLEKIALPVPALEVQQEIVAEIEKYQKIIDGARQVVDNWKPQIEIDTEWPIYNLDELVNITTGKLNANAASKNGKYPFFTCSKKIYKIGTYSFDCEALLLAGNNASADYDIKYYMGKFDAYQRTYIITIKNTDQILYSYLQVILEQKLPELKSKSIGNLTKYLTLGVINQLEIPLPSVKMQHEIVEKIEDERKVVDGCRELIRAYEDKIKKVVDGVWGE